MRVIIEKIVSHGDGLARAGSDVYFVPGVLPGEEVEVRVLSRRKNVVTCELVEIITPSSKRVAPFCPHWGICGGCNMQFTTAQEGVRIKEGIVLENLRRIGRIDTSSFQLDPPITKESRGYRQRARFQVDLTAGRIGYYARGSHEVVDIRNCPILVPALNSLLSEQRERIFSVAERTARGKGIATVPALAGTDGEVSLDDTPVSISVQGKTLRASAGVFFQNHIGVLGQLVTFIQQYTEGKKVVDLFSGVGTFASFVESPDRETLAVEHDTSCLSFARENLRYTRFFTKDVESWSADAPLSSVDTVIVDPPRSGLSPVAHRTITQMRAQAVIYVSCDSATFARDAASFMQQGYRIERLAY
ncbi:MAG: class I SAM-dependent RNA methyltransferase, partial [Sphaerochaetaceae bacterium]|nr:class I SAM-dependent RNA methyltransferase [Sphaerochaetaceae bacterium]